MALETSITNNILEYLNGLKGCVAEKVLGCASQKDRPDVNCFYQGQSYRIEVKSPEHGNMPTKGQILNLKKWAKAGAICIVVWSLDDVKNSLNPCLGLMEFGPNFKGWIVYTKGITKCGHKNGGKKHVDTET
jgi:hypothetical protein